MVASLDIFRALSRRSVFGVIAVQYGIDREACSEHRIELICRIVNRYHCEDRNLADMMEVAALTITTS